MNAQDKYNHVFEQFTPATLSGHVTKVSSGHLEATGPLSCVGDICEVEGKSVENERTPSKLLMAEVTHIDDRKVILVPFGSIRNIRPGARVTSKSRDGLVPVGDVFLGRIIDALANPLDGRKAILPTHFRPLHGVILAPLDRETAKEIKPTGIKAIDGLLPIGTGQRIGIFAASGVGKTSLLSQITLQTSDEICILCLVGERGHEVDTLWSQICAKENSEKYCCVAATSDKSAALRVRAVYQSLALAEYWRDQGKKVTLVVDSVTRFAMALREIGLNSGEPPTLRAYTPNVFDALPRLVERCGAAKSGGAITAFISVLSETDENDDPITEVMKSLLDGHIILSRQLAESGQFPAIDITKSISRQSKHIMKESHSRAAQKAISLLSVYEESRIMIESGIYKIGTNSKLDEAINIRDQLRDFLKQNQNQHSDISITVTELTNLCKGVA